MLINASQINKVAINASAGANQVDIGLIDFAAGASFSANLHNKIVDISSTFTSGTSLVANAGKRLSANVEITAKSDLNCSLEFRNDYIVFMDSAVDLEVSAKIKRGLTVPVIAASEMSSAPYNLRVGAGQSHTSGSSLNCARAHIIYGIATPIVSAVEIDIFPLVFFDRSIKIKDCDLPKTAVELDSCVVYNTFPIIEQN